jgi:hypothetical protein
MSGAVDSPSTAASSVRSVSSATTFSEAADDNASSGSSESDTVDPFSDDESSNPDTYDGTDTASIVSHSAAMIGLTGPPYVSFATDLLADYEVRHSRRPHKV